MSSSNNGEGGVHILVFPYPAQGHILPLLELTRQLSHSSLQFTILVTPKNLPILHPLLSAHPSIRTLVLPFLDSRGLLPAGVENVKDVGNSGNLAIMASLSELRGPIIEWFGSHPDPPVAILYDFFCGWVQDMAREIGVPSICFYSSGAFLASFLHCAWRNVEVLRGLEVVEFPELPNSPTFVREHLPSIIKNYNESDPDWEIIRRGMIENTKSWGLVINTFDHLEGEYLRFLKGKMGNERVYSIGPLGLVSGLGREGPSSDDRSVFEWLEGCPDESVVYVAFGSQKLMKKAQLEALSDGLEKSGVRFILVVKEPTAEQASHGYGSVPVRFEDRVAGRGLVIRGWVPQVEILNHRAVGGFLSHCGWNSTLEAVAAGVLLLGWPMEADQYVNAILLVDDLGISVRVCEGADTVPNSTELARKIGESINGNAEAKLRAKEMRDKALDAVKVDGSSRKDLDKFVQELSKLKVPKSPKPTTRV